MIETEDQRDHHIHDAKVQRYYRLHSLIYDATRWSFLFGRNELLKRIPLLPSRPRILEVGCGTGQNMKYLQSHYPEARIVGIDLSPDMLQKAANRLTPSPNMTLINAKYEPGSTDLAPFDLILFSYSLTMFQDIGEEMIQQLSEDLKPGGFIAAVDFHTTPFSWFRRWMERNHVEFTGRLFPLLNRNYSSLLSVEKQAYLGLWSYFMYIGRHD